MYIVHDINIIKKTIRKVLKKHGILGEVESVNNYRTISVNNNAEESDDNLYIWIRLLNIPGTDRYIAEIANITLPLNARRKNTFTEMYNELLKCKYIEEIRIISVCTLEMKKWCEKHKLKSYNGGCDYTSKVS